MPQSHMLRCGATTTSGRRPDTHRTHRLGIYYRAASTHHVETHATLPEHNGERQKPGRWHAPQDPHSSIASAASDLAFALTKSGSASLATVLGRQFTTTDNTNTMTPTTDVDHAGTPHALECYHVSKNASMLAFCLGGGLCD